MHIKHLQFCVIRNTVVKRGNFNRKVSFMMAFHQSHGHCCRLSEPLSKMTWLHLLLILKRREGEMMWTAHRILWAMEQWLWSVAGVVAAEGQVDDVASQRVQPRLAWMSYWSATNIDHDKPLFLLESLSAAESTRLTWRQTLPTFLFIHLWHNKWILKDSRVQHSMNRTALKMRGQRLKHRQRGWRMRKSWITA